MKERKKAGIDKNTLEAVSNSTKTSAKAAASSAVWVQTGCVGLVPFNALVDAGRHYNDDMNADLKDLVHSAVSGLQLDVLDEFIPEQRINEWAAEAE